MSPVDFHERSTRPSYVFQRLLGLAPRSRVTAGMTLIAAGVLVTVLLWNRGVVWGWALFAFGAGTLIFFSGLAGLRKEKERARRLAGLEARKDALLDCMVAEKRDGRNPVRWLNDQGIHDAEIRGLLIDGMNERLKRPSGK
jgi:hypothetical protein